MRSGFMGVCGLLLLSAAELRPQISISTAGASTENFNAIGTTATATLPANWKMSAAGVTAPTWADATNVTATTIAASSGQPANGGRYNWGSSITPSDRAIGFMTSSGYASPNSIMAQCRNNTSATLTGVTVGFDLERYRTNTTAASVSFFYSLDGLTWTPVAAGDVSAAALPAGSSAYDFAVSGGSFVSVVNRAFTIASLNLAPAADLFLRWTFNTGGANSQGLGLDNFTISPPAPVINGQPSPQTVTVEGSASFSVTATGNGALSYQWRRAGITLTGNPSANTATLSLSNVTSANAGTYDVIVSDPLASTISAPATLTVTKAAANVFLGSLTQTYNGAPRTATATTSPAGRTVVFTYNGSATPPTNAGSYVLVGTINDPDYQGSATDTFTIGKASATLALGSLNQAYTGMPRAASATTMPAGLTVDFTYDGSSSPPSSIGVYSLAASVNDLNYQGSAFGAFIISPAGQTIAFPATGDHLPDDAPFAVTATASSGLPVTFTLVSGSPAVATLSGNIVTLNGSLGAITIRATQDGGGNFAPATPVDRTFHVVAVLTPPGFSTQPTGVTVLLGETVTLTGAATGSPAPSYQWQKDGVPIVGATSATLSIPNAKPADSGLYVLNATNSLGTASSVPVTVLVNKRPQSLSFGTTATTIPAGSSVTLNPLSNSGLPVTLAFLSGSGSLSGNVLTGTGGDIVLRASQAGNATYAATTLDRTFSFVAGGAAPFFLTSPADQTADAGGTATFRASALGTPAPTYQWQKDGVPIAGGDNGTLTLTGLTLADAGRYTVTATNSGGVVTASATLIVRAAPVILSSPADLTAMAGAAAEFVGSASGVPAPTVQWRKNGVPIPGATGLKLAFASVRSTDAARYDVIATNALGAATSASAVLTVTTRDFSGDYFGRFAGDAGNFALRVRSDGSAVFLGHLPATQTGFVVAELKVDLAGKFTLVSTTLAGAPPASLLLVEASAPPLAAAPQTVTVSGALDDATATVTGSVPELGVTFDGTRAARTGTAAAQSGYYQSAIVGSAADRGYFIVAPDGALFGLFSRGGLLNSVSDPVKLGADGRLVLAQTGSGAAPSLLLDLTFSNGAVKGTVGTSPGTTTTLVGAAEGLSGTEHLVNVSVRSTTSPGVATLITGFVVAGTTPKQVLIRAAGPALGAAPFNLPGVLNDPTLQLYRGSNVLAQNDDWGTPAANAPTLTAAAARVGAFAFRTGSADAALLTTLTPGAYTVVIGGGAGTTLAEVYEVLDSTEPPGARRLANLSARGLASPAGPLIAGFVITGTAPQRVLVRGVGPALGAAPFNLAGALANPQLTLFRGSTVIRTNDDWFRDADATAIRDAAVKVGAFPLGSQSLDAAMLLFLEPGAYTVQITGAASSIGIALIEVYEATP